MNWHAINDAQKVIFVASVTLKEKVFFSGINSYMKPQHYIWKYIELLFNMKANSVFPTQHFLSKPIWQKKFTMWYKGP